MVAKEGYAADMLDTLSWRRHYSSCALAEAAVLDRGPEEGVNEGAQQPGRKPQKHSPPCHGVALRGAS